MNTTLQPIEELDNLSEDHRDQLREWLVELSIRKTMAKLRDEWSIIITYNKLQRYRQRLLAKDQVSEHLDHKMAMAEFLDLLNGNPVPYDEAGLALIQKRAFEAACAPRIAVSSLATLQRVFNHKNARADIEFRKKIAERNTALREAKLALDREKHTTNLNSKLKTKNLELCPEGRQCDNLGPLARNWDDVRRRAQKKFGITPEESARRAELRRTWKNPNSESASAPNLTLNRNPPHLESRSDQQHLGNQLEVALGTPFTERTSLSGDQTSGGLGKPNPPSQGLNIVDLLKDLAADFPSPSREESPPTLISRDATTSTTAAPTDQEIENLNLSPNLQTDIRDQKSEMSDPSALTADHLTP